MSIPDLGWIWLTAYSVMPTHGKITPLEQLINITAYPYPDFDISRWRKRAALCNESSVKKNKDD